MIDACQKGKIDLILTKSISRFSRNTLDCLHYIRLLKDKKIAVYFEKENINTLDAKGEVLITIMASIAQQESASISQNVAMGIRYKMQRGIGRINYTRFLGFTKETRDGPLLIVPDQADLVRRIFREYLEGFSPAMIAAHLQAEEILSPGNSSRWHASTISSMLKNEKYCGDFLMQKTFTEDYLTKRCRKNTGQLPQYYVENHHEPIIPKPVFLQVQGELLRRSVLKADPTKVRCSKRISLCGRLVCGRCGKILKRYTRPEHNQTDWRCHNRAYPKKTNHQDNKSACGCRFVPEREVHQAIVDAFNLLPEHRDQLIRMHADVRHHLEPIDIALEKTDSDHLAAQREDLLLERANFADKELKIRLLLELTDIMNDQKKMADRAQRILSFREAGSPVTCCSRITGESPSAAASCYSTEVFFLRTRFPLTDNLLSGDGYISHFDNQMVVRYLDFVTVQDDGLAIHFKAGLSFFIARKSP